MFRVRSTCKQFDRLRLLDDWLRHTLLPRMPDRTRWVFCGRFTPRIGWLATPGWSGVVAEMQLTPLSETASRAILERRGVSELHVPSFLAVARGTPLALTLVSARDVPLVENTGALGSEGVSPQALQGAQTVIGANESRVLVALAERFIDALPNSLRDAVEAASVVRRVTRPMLVAMLGESCDDALVRELSELSFVDRTPDGLTLDETVRYAVASRLTALDPARRRSLRQKAVKAMIEQLEGPVPLGSEAWRLLSDLLYVVDHPEIREAFFPSKDGAVSMDCALPRDYGALRALVEVHEPPAWFDVFEAWWRWMPAAFRVARDGWGAPLGFAMVASTHELVANVVDVDPMLRLWCSDLGTESKHARGALFVRRSLGSGAQEIPDEVRAAIWLDVKRAYIEQPTQWGIYLATRHFEVVPQRLHLLGFRRAPLVVDGEGTLRLEFGPAGVWSWIRGLVDTESPATEGSMVRGVQVAHEEPPRDAWRLDSAARALVVDGRPVVLSALEYQVLSYLLQRANSIVTRDELLDAVWQQRNTGSNVVDAVVRLIRKKLGVHSTDLETVRGHGYRVVRLR